MAVGFGSAPPARYPAHMRAYAVSIAFWTAFAALLFPCMGCSSDDDVKPSPIPPGYAMLLRQHGGEPPRARPRDPSGEKVDELLAVVDGEVLTRREVLRRLRLPETPDPDDDREEEIRGTRLTWAQQQLVVSAARRAGLQIPASVIDDIAEEQLDKQRKEYEEESGETISRADYLVQRKLKWSEFRRQIADAVAYEYYLKKLMSGVGGPTRPMLDFGVSPAEVRRVYYDHKKLFDVQRGVKFALLQMRIERFETEGRDFIDAEAAAVEAANKVAADFRTGIAPEDLAKKYEIEKGDWRVTPDFIVDFRQPEGKVWLFDTQRRAPDATVFTDPGGPIVLGLIEIRPARERQLDEVYDEIVARLQTGKQARLVAQLTIDQLHGGSNVWPEELADELLDDAHGLLDKIAADDVLSGARLK